MASRLTGTMFLKIDGQPQRIKGSWNYNLGVPMREVIVGSDSVHGYKETPQAPFISGAITHTPELDMEGLLNVKNATIQLELGNNKIIALNNAFFEGEGTASTEEAEIEVKFVGTTAGEI